MAQAKKYDPQGAYVKLWLPELAAIPTSRVHQAADLSAAEQEQYGVLIGQHYPHPVLSYDRWLA
jgi:deoxyribodipyrimidine photo-lyase